MRYIKKIILLFLLAVFMLSLTACTLYGLGERIITKGNYYMNGFGLDEESGYVSHFYFERGKVYNLKVKDTVISRGKYKVKSGIVSFTPNAEYTNSINDLVIKNEFLFENKDANYLNSIPESNEVITKLKSLVKVDNNNITYDVAFGRGEEYIFITVEREPKKEGKGYDNNSYIYSIFASDQGFTIKDRYALTKNADDIWSVMDGESKIIENFFYYNGNIAGTKKEVLILEFFSLK